MAESRKYTQIPKIITPRPSLPSPLHSRKTSSSGQESPSPKSSGNDSTGSSIPSFRTLKNFLVFNKSQSDGGSPKGAFSLGAVRKSLAGERKASSSSLDQKEYDDPNVADIIIGPISSPMHQDLSTILESDTSALSRHRMDHDDSQDDIRLQLPLTSRSHPPSGRQSPESAASSHLDLSTTKLGEEVRNAMTSKTVGWSSDVILDELSKESTRVIDIEPLNPDVANLLGPSQRLLARSQSSSPIRESPFDAFNVGAQSSPTRPRVHRRIPTLSSLPKGPQPGSGIPTHNSSPTSRTSFDQRDKDRFTPRRNLQFGPSPPNPSTSTSTTQAAKDRLYSPASRFATPLTTRLPSHRNHPFSDSETTTPSSSGRPSTRLSSETPVSSSSPHSRPGSAAMREHPSRNRSMSVSESSTTSGPVASRQFLGSGSGTIRPALRNPPLNRSTSASHHAIVGQIGPSATRALAAAGIFSEGGSVNGGGRDSRAHSRLSDDIRSSGSGGWPLSRLSDHTRSSSIDRPSSGMRSMISTTTNTYYPPLYTTPSRSSVSGETEASSSYGGGIPRSSSSRPGRNRSLSQTLTMSELGVLSGSTAGSSNSSSGRHGHGPGSIATTATSRTGSSLSVSIPRHRPRNSGSGGGGSSSARGGSPSGGRPSPSPYYPYPRTTSSSASRSSPTFTGSTSTTMTGSMTSSSSTTTTTSASAASSAIMAMREKHELEMEALLSALSDSQRTSKVLREENNGLRDKVIVLEEEVNEVRGENEEFRAALVDAEGVREENEELRERIAQLEMRLAEAMEYVGRLREDVDRTRAISRKYMRQVAVSPLAKNMIVADDDDDDEDDEAVGLEPLPSASTIRFQLPPPPEPSVLVEEEDSKDPSVRRSRKSPSLSSAEFPNMPSNMSMLLHDPGESQLERDSFISRDDDDHNDMMDDDLYHGDHHWDDHSLRSPSPTLMLGSTAYHHHQRLHSRQTSSGNLSQSTENLSMLTENLPDSPHSLELRPEHEMHLEEMPSQLDLHLQPEHELFPQLIIGADHR